MKRMMVATLGAIVISAAGMYAQAKPAPAAEGTKFSGCLVPGGSSDKFTLVNAQEKGQKDKRTLKVVPASDKVDVAAHVTQEVEIVGTVTGTGSAATLNATKITRKSDYCG